MKQIDTFYIRNTMHSVQSWVYSYLNHKKVPSFFKLTAICYCLHGLNDDVNYDGYNSKYSSGLCKMRFNSTICLLFQ